LRLAEDWTFSKHKKQTIGFLLTSPFLDYEKCRSQTFLRFIRCKKGIWLSKYFV